MSDATERWMRERGWGVPIGALDAGDALVAENDRMRAEIEAIEEARQELVAAEVDRLRDLPPSPERDAYARKVAEKAITMQREWKLKGYVGVVSVAEVMDAIIAEVKP